MISWIIESKGRILELDENSFAIVFGKASKVPQKLSDILPALLDEPTAFELSSENPTDTLHYSALSAETRQAFPTTIRIRAVTDASYQVDVELMPYMAGAISIKEDGHIVSANDAFITALLGRTSQEVTGRHIDQVIPDISNLKLFSM
jgi:hypothetical protein